MTEELAVCRRVLRAGSWTGPAGRLALGYEARLLRRRRLEAEDGSCFLLDLPETLSVDHGDAFELADGRRIAVAAADEPLCAVRGPLARLAWHIGNRHTPCQIEAERLLIQRDHVLRDMLLGLGAEVTEIVEPFLPEGGAYGHGRTMGHEHGHGHGHGHDQAHERQGDHVHA